MNTSSKNIPAEQVAILREHLGEIVSVDGLPGEVKVSPLSLDDLLNTQVIEDVAVIGRTLYNSIDKLQAMLKEIDGKPGAEGVENVVLEILKPCLPATKRVLRLCLDRDLNAIPLHLVPGTLSTFVKQNFSGPRLKPWVALLGGLRTREKATPSKSPSTSETPSSS